MNERFRHICVHVFISSILLVPYCASEFSKDTSSNAEVINDSAEEQRNRPDPSIEQIFRSSREQKDTDFKRGPEDESDKCPSSSDEAGDKRVRVKRENAKRSNSKRVSEAGKNDDKRSASSKVSKAPSRTDRASRDLPKLASKDSTDYEASADLESSEYADEIEDESAAGSESKESRYKGGEFRVGDDSEKFIDQEERSSLYDDFESKDVVKRGISGAEDYEEANEESGEAVEDTAALDERESLDEEAGKRKVHGDARVKREREESKFAENSEVAGKEESAGASSDSTKDTETSLKDASVAEEQASKADRESSQQADQSKRNIPEKQEKDESKGNVDPKSANDQQELERNENPKSLKDESQETAGDRKSAEAANLQNDKKTFAESPSVESSSRLQEPKIVADVANPEAAKVEVPINGGEAQASEAAGKIESPGSSEAASSDQADLDYEKRMEEQIQRKIDSIKEQIKREIAENQRIKAIEENNAKFDELLDEEGEEQEQSLESAVSDKNENLSKRSVKNSGKSQVRETAEKRSIRRRKRQDDNSEEKLRSNNEASSNADKKSIRGLAKKRSAAKVEQLPTIAKVVSKREYPRQVFLVRHNRNLGKKRRRRRAKNSFLVPEQGSVKLEENLSADATSGSNLRRELNDGKQQPSSSGITEEERALAEQSSLFGKKSGSMASLTASEELGPLATEYGDAFGGMHGEPGVALARFKRIKRVLRPPASKT